MTIASEITRLQNDKAAMCAAIENKWVTVGNVTFDDYASCIDAISSWGGKTVCFLMVGGGGWWGASWSLSGWGWGAWGVQIWKFAFTSNISVSIWLGGNWGTCCARWSIWWNSTMVDVDVAECSITAYWWWGGGWWKLDVASWLSWWSGGGASGGSCSMNYNDWGVEANPMSWEMASSWGANYGCSCCNLTIGSWWWGATESGMGNVGYDCETRAYSSSPWRWGKWVEGTFWGKTVCIAWGWWGGSFCSPSYNFWCWKSGWWNWWNRDSRNWNAATTCGSWWGGASHYNGNYSWGKWWDWLVIIWYNCECKDCNWFTCATWWNSCYVCNGMKWHCFTSSGTFTILS